jgi:hypothetical protein
MAGNWGSPRVLFATLTTVITCVAVLCTASAATAAECGNEALREQQHATFLGDCRAYEMVSPPGAIPKVVDTGAGRGQTAGVRAANVSEGLYAAGIAWFSYYPTPEAEDAGNQFLSLRTTGGWATASVNPSQSTGTLGPVGCHFSSYLSAGLSHLALRAGWQTDTTGHGEQEYCGRPEPRLVEDEPEGFQNVYIRNNTTGSYELSNLTPAGVPPADATFQDASADFGAVVFSESAPLTPAAPNGEALYDAADGSVHLVSVLPDGTGVEGRIVNASSHPATSIGGTKSGGADQSAAPTTNAVATDGSRVFFEAGKNLYVRVNPAGQSSALEGTACLEQTTYACTVQVDASQAGGPGGGGSFAWATSSGSMVFFRAGTGAGLTTDTQPRSGVNLYAYNTDTGTLSDLTPYSAANVLGFSGLGESASGVVAYFVASAALTGPNREGVAPKERQRNLYAATIHGQSTTLAFIGTLAPSDGGDWGPTGAAQYLNLKSRVSPDGNYIAFNSVARLTAYDNTDATSGAADDEIYLYDAESATLSCVSCRPDGAKPETSAGFPGEEPSSPFYGPGYLQRNVLNSGQVFFDSAEPLIARAANGVENVYEYSDGQLRLVSTGTSTRGAYFFEATPDGRNVYFVTTQGLVPSDTDNGLSLYDAREEGGLPERAEARAECEEAAVCRPGGSGLTPLSTPSSVDFVGVGNMSVRSGRAVHTAGRKGLQGAIQKCRYKYRHRPKQRRRCVRRVRTLHANASKHGTQGGHGRSGHRGRRVR